MMNWKTATFLVLVSLLVGCSSKDNYIILDAMPDGSTGAIRIETDTGEAVLNQADTAVYISDRESRPSAPVPITDPEAEAVFDAALQVHPLMPESFLLYFGLDSNRLTPESSSVIPRIVASVQKRQSTDISVIGHTDRTGKDEYNRKLSLDRAKAVIDLLTAANINADSITVSYYGEGDPLVPTADNVPEPRNRRVEVLVR